MSKLRFPKCKLPGGLSEGVINLIGGSTNEKTKKQYSRHQDWFREFRKKHNWKGKIEEHHHALEFFADLVKQGFKATSIWTLNKKCFTVKYGCFQFGSGSIILCFAGV
jgi:hypothetical protein